MRLILTLVLLCVSTAACFSENSSPGEPKNKTDAPQNNNQPGTPTAAPSLPPGIMFSPVIKVLPNKEREEPSRCATAKDWKEWGAFAWCRSIEWINTERVIAIFTVILGSATAFLFLATRSLVKGANKTAEYQLRAYISVTPKLVLNWKHKTNRPGISFDIENHGQTIGFEICHSYSFDILDSPLPEGHTFREPNRQFDQNNSLFPRTSVPVRLLFERLLTAEEITAIEHGNKRFHTWGITSYRDAFQQMRTTRFSFSFGGPDFANSMKKVPGAKWNWEHGQHHNDAT